MEHQYLMQQAELHRQANGIAIAPDPPIWLYSGKVAEGPLAAMLKLWNELPQSHQRSHSILINGRPLGETEIRTMLAEMG